MSAELADRVIEKVLAIKDKPVGTSAGLSQSDILQLCRGARQIFLGEPSVLEVKAPVTVCGDLHGQFHDLIRIFEKCEMPPATSYLFLGDYVDRGRHSIETISLLFALKIKHPDKVFMLRGNHECPDVNKTYGFYDECLQFYSVTIWRVFSDVFKCLPIAAVVSDKIFCIHGGISPKLKSIDDIKALERPTEIGDDMLFDLLWSDPNPHPKPGAEAFQRNDRGGSYRFTLEPVEEFLRANGFTMICRSHQAITDGYEYPFHPSEAFVTVFSAPNYCYTYHNKGAVMHVAEDGTVSYTIFEPVEFEFVRLPNGSSATSLSLDTNFKPPTMSLP